ncbi:hypothetical protein HHL17_06365 [Chitinophaga sp. G-6-1-13]|uniref:Uncharacterized protein n=1 Tax=Chitinophaga fulva TaxID=2728842 RepID=A0A848GDS2_9BACT|nr:hypothetical protein [Chitinophaga fulva]NML36815.1 hypothetical protein [Chitinophaga fulva]
MKKTLLAIALFAVSMGAFAKGTKAKETAPKVIEMNVNNTKITVSTKKSALASDGFGFRDGCGNILIVYVSGGTFNQRGHAAFLYAQSHMDANGCF